MSGWLNHLIATPIVLPLAISSLMLLLDERRRKLRGAICLGTVVALLALSWVLLEAAEATGSVASAAYLLGDWMAPFGIALLADRLSSLMVLLTSVLGLGALLFALARWDRAGPSFHPLFLLLLMGVNGAFLTCDLFNLFVFFEVLLAASYGLLLHGSGAARVKAGLHYIAVNLTASLLLLIGIALIYGVTGTLNMADLSVRIPRIAATDRMLFEVGCALLSVAFLTKAAMWPLGFWLPAAYSASSAPVAAVFAILTKVGIYVVLRLSLLLFGAGAGVSAGFGERWILLGGLLTIGFGSVGVLAARTLSRIAGFCVFISSGTLLAVIGTGGQAALSGGLFYLTSSTLAIGAFFLLIELLNRARGSNAPAVAEPVFSDEYQDPYESGAPENEVGVPLPFVIALLGGGFLLCALLLASLPPLSGFIGKLAILVGLISSADDVAKVTWLLLGLLTASSLATLIALLRVGVEVLWTPSETSPPRVASVELASIAGLLVACVLLTIQGDAVLRYMDETAAWLYAPENYVRAVLGAPRAPAGQMAISQ